MVSNLTFRAGASAAALVQERGLRAEDVDIVPGASGGAKWLSIGGLDRFLFGEFLQAPRERAMRLIGSSIGSWRMACFAQRDPVAALARGHHGYIYDQVYTPRPSPREVTGVLTKVLDDLLGEAGVDEILSHPWAKLHVITAMTRRIPARGSRALLGAALGAAALGNLVSRKTLGLGMRRFVFHSGSVSPFEHLADLPTLHARLTQENARAVLLASGAIPMVVEGVEIPGRPGEVHWDGGVLDYHLDLDFGPTEGLILYPHFYDHIVPGWFDKGLKWRRSWGGNFDRVLLIAPSAEFVASLPGGKIPDRKDFYAMSHSDRIRRWQGVVDASAVLGEELGDLIESGKVRDRVTPLGEGIN
ncbi:MAG: patatin-like phospholipase family protein [Gemmatimonadaceae bacterium]